MSPKEAFPIALCSVMNLAGVLGKGVTLVPVIRGLPAGSGGEPKSHTPEPCLPPSPVPDHLPLSPGLVSSDKESAAHILSRKGGGNLLPIVVGGV